MKANLIKKKIQETINKLKEQRVNNAPANLTMATGAENTNTSDVTGLPVAPSAPSAASNNQMNNNDEVMNEVLAKLDEVKQQLTTRKRKIPAFILRRILKMIQQIIDFILM